MDEYLMPVEVEDGLVVDMPCVETTHGLLAFTKSRYPNDHLALMAYEVEEDPSGRMCLVEPWADISINIPHALLWPSDICLNGDVPRNLMEELCDTPLFSRTGLSVRENMGFYPIVHVDALDLVPDEEDIRQLLEEVQAPDQSERRKESSPRRSL